MRVPAVLFAAVWLATLGGPRALAEEGCALSAAKPMMLVEFFFGLSREGRGPVSEREWHHFEEDTLNRDFPDGMTVQSASGKWMDPATRHEVSEPSKTVLAVTGEAPDLMKRIEDVSEVYKRRFRQKSVGIVSQRVCARF